MERNKISETPREDCYVMCDGLRASFHTGFHELNLMWNNRNATLFYGDTFNIFVNLICDVLLLNQDVHLVDSALQGLVFVGEEVWD